VVKDTPDPGGIVHNVQIVDFFQQIVATRVRAVVFRQSRKKIQHYVIPDFFNVVKILVRRIQTSLERSITVGYILLERRNISSVVVAHHILALATDQEHQAKQNERCAYARPSAGLF
jgi:hypothetical protein